MGSGEERAGKGEGVIEGTRERDDRAAYEDGPLTEGHEGFSGAPGSEPLERELWCAAVWEEHRRGA